MGGNVSTPRTPLACMLKRFDKVFKGDYGGVPFDPETLRYFCEIAWVKLNVSWPPQGSFNEDIVNLVYQSVVNDTKQFAYIDCWKRTVLRNPKWLRRLKPKPAGLFPAQVVPHNSSGLQIAQPAPSGLQISKTVSSGLQIPQGCDSHEEDWAPPPYQPFPAPAAPRPPQREMAPAPDGSLRTQASAPSLPDEEQHHPASPMTEKRTYDFRDRNKDRAVTTAPLREVIQVVPQSDGSSLTIRAYQFLPFSSTDLVHWKTSNPSYSENPQKLTELCESIMSSHNPTWADCNQLLLSLFSREERTRVRDEAVKILKARVPAQENEATWIAAKCPDTDPGWDYNKPEQLDKLRDYQKLLIEAMKAGMKKPVNLSKPAEVIQGPTETPDRFYERLLDAYQRYTPLDVSDPANQRLINMAFVAQSFPDVRRKLQRQEGFAGQPISFLLELARRVFNNRDEAERKEKDLRAQRKSQLLAAALVQSASSGLANAGTQETGQRRAKPNECFNCFETTHRLANCPYPRKAHLNRRRNHQQKASSLLPQGVSKGQVISGVYQPRSHQQQCLLPISAPNPPVPPQQTQELVGVAAMSHWDIPE